MPKVSSVMVPYATYLRVYEPLAAFPEPERGHWARYARRPDRPSSQDEIRRALAGLAATPPAPVPAHESDDAFVLESDGVVRVCPWRTRLRGWQALGELAEDFPLPVLDALLPPVVRHQATQDYERWLAGHPDARPWIRTATWQVPINWFVLFADDEREYVGRSAAEAPVLRYRTPWSRPGGGWPGAAGAAGRHGREPADRRPRGRRALAGGVPSAGAGRTGLRRTGARAAGRSARGDHSAADVAEGIAALRRGDEEGAGAAYGRLVERWRSVRNLRSAN
ncbi:hypothetical protein SHKM778_91880 [Streptomyces sp. KM77-8]|uniref:DUF8083 domain-containing protein n=1 Tax=Streptomyces haneummycinicus TaxID=3074435 RepID=A0AAT9HZL2_9ACTN